MDLSQITEDPFVVRKCDPLHPLSISTDRALRAPGRSGLPGRGDLRGFLTLHTLVASSNRSFFEFEFGFELQRRPEDSLSVCSLLVDANSKLQRVKQEYNNPLLMTHVQEVEAAIDVIFRVLGRGLFYGGRRATGSRTGRGRGGYDVDASGRGEVSLLFGISLPTSLTPASI